MKTLTEADIIAFFSSYELPADPKEADYLLQRIIDLVAVAQVSLWNAN